MAPAPSSLSSLAPRLLTAAGAADYLSVPRAAMKRIREGRILIDGRARWDRFALDAWLDAQRPGVAPSVEPPPQSGDDADAALDRWLADQGHAARSA